MKIVGYMVCGPNEPLLKECLDRIQKLQLDHFLIAGNNTDEASEKLIKSYGIEFYRDDREWGKYQPNIKTKLLMRAGEHSPDWIVAQDADEFFDEAVTRETLEELANRGGVAWNFYVVNYWNDDKHYAKGLSFWNVRFFRYTPQFGLNFINKPVHCGLAPPMQYRYANDSPYILWHYGLMDKEKRKNKVERYKKYDPSAQHKSELYYNALADETPPAELDKDDMRTRVREDVKNRHMKTNPVREDPEGYVYMEKDGRMIDVLKKDARRYERQGWKVSTDIKMEVDQNFYEEGDETVADVEPANELECGICGQETKSLAGLKSHIRLKHGA